MNEKQVDGRLTGCLAQKGRLTISILSHHDSVLDN